MLVRTLGSKKMEMNMDESHGTRSTSNDMLQEIVAQNHAG
jgi:hypothetical protein